ncbi:cell wall elongation regulator TseB-like domain-containing protein [Jeotgalibacillus campisalis]|uniref:Cell wall elongation regulator TseB-like domain-containing protein n=1 Tax=Jeotgalibacillus campisalis TaxID=220754 RepID=A0A0C2VGP3_9BACL|nr:DUF5590 domain-containing protein [Jeotgalibacillus campisalis]KIL48032.1 hypothetical protein KR50_21990 [Jeotgalibacillus campisalis]
MKKWMVLVPALLIVTILIISITIYSIARQPLNASIDQAEAKAREELQFSQIEESYPYNGTKAYSVIQGTAEDQQMVAFIPKDEEEDPTTRRMEEGISEDEVIAMLNETDEPTKIMSSRLGLESEGPVWEIIYLDNDKMLNYYYVLFDSGEWWRTIRNL